MVRSVSRRVVAISGALGALLSAAACTDDGASLHVVCPIRAEIEGDSCLFAADSEECEFAGVLNLAAATHYDSALSVESGLSPRASDVPPRAEPNRVALNGGEVELRKTNGALINFGGLKNPYPFVGSGTVEPGGRGVMSVTLIPPQYVDLLRENAAAGDDALDQIIVAVKVKGRTDGQVDVESAEWRWPVRLISTSPVRGAGCLDISYCVALAGMDSFASACLCGPSDKPSCAL